MGWYLSTQGVHRYFIPEDYVFAPGTIELEEKNYLAPSGLDVPKGLIQLGEKSMLKNPLVTWKLAGSLELSSLPGLRRSSMTNWLSVIQAR